MTLAVASARDGRLMFGTCLFCASRLGTNDVVERFPVGRRVAFDVTKGRLWVVCLACTQWNLAPLEERWEAVESCERLFRATRLRISTDNVGLARHGSGLELVRVGRPLRPELAAWRYGPRLARRRLTHLAWGGVGVLASGASLLTSLAAGPVALFTAGWLWSAIGQKRSERVIARSQTDRGVPITLRACDTEALCVVRRDGTPEGWALRVTDAALDLELAGPEALRAAGLVLAQLNARGATRDQVRAAAERLDHAGDSAAAFIAAAGTRSGREGLPLWTLIGEESLALEMATHDESERRAMEGELAALEAAWRSAEEIAAIADDLLLPPGIHDFISRQKARLDHHR